VTVRQVLTQGSGGSIRRTFAEPASHAFAEFLQQVQRRFNDSCKLIRDIESVLCLLNGPLSLAYVDEDGGEHEGNDGLEQAHPDSGDELEAI
jgi:hypothetical protein